MLKLDLNECSTNRENSYSYARSNDYEIVKKQLAEYSGVREEKLVITNGSFHALDLILGFMFKWGDKILLPIPTFPCYEKFEQYGSLNFIKLIYEASFFERTILKAIQNTFVQGLYLANPNNPVGYVLSHKEIHQLVANAQKKNILVILDEAYFEFCNVTGLDLIEQYNNLIIVRTLSKAFGLAGVRLGYIITSPDLAKKLEKFKGPTYTISHLAMNIGLKTLSIDGQKKMKDCVTTSSNIRGELANFLFDNGYKVFPSQTNFLTFQCSNSKKMVNELNKRKILVKDLNDYPDGQPILKNCIRLTIPPVNKLPQLKKELVRLFG